MKFQKYKKESKKPDPAKRDQVFKLRFAKVLILTHVHKFEHFYLSQSRTIGFA